MNLADVEARVRAAPRGFFPGGKVLANVIACHFEGHARAGARRNGARRDARPWRPARARVLLGKRLPVLHRPVRACAAAAVAELYRRHGAHRLDEVRDAPVLANLPVVVYAGTLVGLPSARFDRGL